jgi:hypothetical protein
MGSEGTFGEFQVRMGRLERVLLLSRHRCRECRWRWFRLGRYRHGSEVRYYCADCAKRRVEAHNEK